MTCIVGLEADGKVFLAGDIQGTGYNNKVVHTQPKVFAKGELVFGYTTSYRFGQLVEHALGNPVVPANDDEVYRWLITVMVPQLKAALKDGGFEGGGNALIGVRGQLWELQNDWSVLRSKLGYSAVGSGYEYAHGAMHTYGKLGVFSSQTAERALKIAVEAAGTFSPSVGMEATVISTQ